MGTVVAYKIDTDEGHHSVCRKSTTSAIEHTTNNPSLRRSEENVTHGMGQQQRPFGNRHKVQRFACAVRPTFNVAGPGSGDEFKKQ
ncbi:WD40 repeat-like protein [Anopheles sinensis]|uniref:WD40 repeat-like protein n=1 Tax=Anopheles sinensis TaxID=74873 RepID=A0A084VBY9_ANOSI|nr:WD40 repeat-like protein [Anopheles sinensis]